MRLIWKLFVAQARQQKVRLSLTALAMITSIGVVLWVISAYETIASKFDDQTSDFVGNYSAFVVPQSPDDGLNPELIEALTSHPALDSANPVTQFRMMLRRGGPPVPPPTGPDGRPTRGMGPMGPMVVGTTATEPRYPLQDGRWLALNADSEAVVSSGVAQALSLHPDDTIEFRSKTGQIVRLTVVGITEQVQDVEQAMSRTKGGAPGGTNRGPASLAVYVPLGVIESLTGVAPKINLVELRLKPQQDSAALAPAVAATTPAAELIDPEDVRAKLASGFAAEGARKQAYFVTALSILASAFIIFTTLSMGVNERARQLAILRAVGLKRTQVAWLVLIEAFVLAILGWVGGLASGWALLQLLAKAQPGLFPDGVPVGGLSVVLTGACSLVGASLASIFPIWKAVRISPLEAMAPLPIQPRTRSWYLGASLTSLLLVMINPVLVVWPGLPETWRFLLILCVGAPACVLGFVFLAPLCVLLVERVFSPVLAAVLRLQAHLVRTQLSSNMWRSAGIAASLMLGLGLYTATQVWGWSMLGGFLPGRWTPNTIVKFDPGLSDEVVERVQKTEGVIADRCFPIAVEQPKLVGDPLKSRERDSAVRQDNVTIIGIDTDAAFISTTPAFDLQFIQGDRETALTKLRKGRHCLVPESLLKYANLGVGQTIGLNLPQSPNKSVDYTIVGVIAEPGANWLTKTTGLRKNFVRTAGLVFAPREQVCRDFDLPLVEFFWLQTQPGTTTAMLEERLKPLVPASERPSESRRTRATVPTSPPSELASREATGPRSAAGANARPGGGARGGGGRGRGGFGDSPVRVSSIDEVRDGLRTRGGAAVRAMGWLPLITLLVVSLGIVNTIAASVRARQWEFGILRSIGLRRFALTRLVLAEALMIGLVASLLSFAFGLLTGWTCLGLVRYVSNPWFEGVATPLVIPWSVIGVGYLLNFLLCVIAAIWPATQVGRAEPLQLLQAGRSAM